VYSRDTGRGNSREGGGDHHRVLPSLPAPRRRSRVIRAATRRHAPPAFGGQIRTCRLSIRGAWRLMRGAQPRRGPPAFGGGAVVAGWGYSRGIGSENGGEGGGGEGGLPAPNARRDVQDALEPRAEARSDLHRGVLEGALLERHVRTALQRNTIHQLIYHIFFGTS